MIKIGCEKTYQDLEKLRKRNASEQEIIEFTWDSIQAYQSGDLYKSAFVADKYAKQENVEAVKREKYYRDALGQLVVNNFVPCHRIRTNYYRILTRQAVQFLLGNGVSLENPDDKEKLGANFDIVVNKAADAAQTKTVSYIFWNNDHCEVFTSLEMVPLIDEETSSLRAAVRWWELDPTKPLRATLYEEDGCTEYIWRKGKDGSTQDGEVLKEKRPYKVIEEETDISGTEITNGQNYPGFPIVPLWANADHICPLDGVKGTIDTIDELVNSLNDDLTETQLFWLMRGADYMDGADKSKFLQDLREQKIANPANGQDVTPYTVSVPYTERQAEINRLENQLYRDFQALNINEIKSGAVTATQIKAAYEPLNLKTDEFEMCVTDCLLRLFKLIPGLEKEKPTFNRSMLINQQEAIQTLEMISSHIPDDYITAKELTILGDIDKIEEIEKQKQADEADRMRLSAALEAMQNQQNTAESEQKEPEAEENDKNEMG